LLAAYGGFRNFSIGDVFLIIPSDSQAPVWEFIIQEAPASG
jgi:hypothetical protein